MLTNWGFQQFDTPLFVGIRIQFTPNSVADNATVGTSLGTATLSGSHSGTASWSLGDDDGGKYAINSATGEVTVAGALSPGTDSITINVSGIVPSAAPKSVNIPVSSSGAAQTVFHEIGQV